jgi:dynein assembly factor 2
LKTCSNSFSNNGESNSALDDWCEEEEVDDDGEGESQKVKKTVRFSNVVHKQLFRYIITVDFLKWELEVYRLVHIFRSNSSILGQRKKNQRKSRNKAKKHNSNVDNPPMSSSAESDHAIPCDVELSDAMESATLCDSGIDVEDSDPGMVQQHGPNFATKKNKKKNHGKTNRRRANSESSTNDLIFDLDL